MGYSKKAVKMEGVAEAEGKKWLLTNGTALRSPLKPIHTYRVDNQKESDEMIQEIEEKCTTPTSDESRIPSSRFIQCPGAPRKRKSTSRKYKFTSGREFFNPPELETLFMNSVNHQRSQLY